MKYNQQKWVPQTRYWGTTPFPLHCSDFHKLSICPCIHRTFTAHGWMDWKEKRAGWMDGCWQDTSLHLQTPHLGSLSFSVPALHSVKKDIIRTALQRSFLNAELSTVRSAGISFEKKETTWFFEAKPETSGSRAKISIWCGLFIPTPVRNNNSYIHRLFTCHN